MSSSMSSSDLLSKLFKSELLTTDEKTQVKLQKNNKVILNFVFPYKVQLAALRIWNYNGHRVNKNIGVRKCHIKMDG